MQLAATCSIHHAVEPGQIAIEPAAPNGLHLPRLPALKLCRRRPLAHGAWSSWPASANLYKSTLPERPVSTSEVPLIADGITAAQRTVDPCHCTKSLPR